MNDMPHVSDEQQARLLRNHRTDHIIGAAFWVVIAVIPCLVGMFILA